MIALLLNQLLAVWLFISGFVLPQSTVTSWNIMIVAVVVSTVAFLAFAAPGRPGIRWILTVVAIWLFASALVLPHESLGTVLHDVAASVALATMSLVPPARWLTHWREHHPRGAAAG